MKKKIFLLVVLLFLLCGCTAEVNLEIKNDKVQETVVINVSPSGDYTMERLPDVFRKYVPIYAKDIIADAEPDTKKSGISYYDRQQEKLANGYKFTYSYNFKLSNYKDARTVKNGFKSSNIYVDNASNTILLSTDNNGLLYFCDEYPLLTDVTVNITSDYKVIESNADYINENVYTWELSKSSNNKSIYMLIDKTSKYDQGYIIDEDLLNGEYSDNNDGSGSTGNNQNKDNNEENKNEEYNSKIEKEMNENPFVFVILGIILFFALLFIFTKVAKITKVR